jgi:hypothetical protein
MRRRKKLLRQEEAAPARPHVQRSEEQSNPILDLQQSHGNAAVSRMVVQRRPRAASTDAPWAKKKKQAPVKKPEDVHARVIKFDIDEAGSRITIASGPDQGVQVGMTGSLISDSGREMSDDFVIETASGRVSTAHVKATADMVKAYDHVVIKASQFVESQAGKEF